jgi:hypothetical protein
VGAPCIVFATSRVSEAEQFVESVLLVKYLSRPLEQCDPSAGKKRVSRAMASSQKW